MSHYFDKGWKDFWEATSKGVDPISAVDLPGIPLRTYLAMCTRVRELLALTRNDRVLNIGCGTGLFEEYVGSAARLIVGMDFAWNMVKRAHERDAGFSNSVFVQGHAIALPFKSAQFDKLLCYSVLQYLSQSEVEALLAELKRVARPAATILIGDIVDEDAHEAHSRVCKAIEIWRVSGIPGLVQRLTTRAKHAAARRASRLRRALLARSGNHVLSRKPAPIFRYSRSRLLRIVCGKGLDATIVEQSEERFFEGRYNILIRMP